MSDDDKETVNETSHRRALVTGANSSMGSHMADLLLREKDPARCYPVVREGGVVMIILYTSFVLLLFQLPFLLLGRMVGYNTAFFNDREN